MHHREAHCVERIEESSQPMAVFGLNFELNGNVGSCVCVCKPLKCHSTQIQWFTIDELNSGGSRQQQSYRTKSLAQIPRRLHEGSKIQYISFSRIESGRLSTCR